MYKDKTLVCKDCGQEFTSHCQRADFSRKRASRKRLSVAVVAATYAKEVHMKAPPPDVRRRLRRVVKRV